MKRVDQLRDLSDDHHTGLVLARRCRRAGGSEELAVEARVEAVWAQVVAVFESHLEPHFAVEEAHLLPALVALGESGAAERVGDEHATLRACLASGARSLEQLVRFGETLDAHIRYEEREVFETTQHRLPAAALDAIATASRRVPRSCPVLFGDGS